MTTATDPCSSDISRRTLLVSAAVAGATLQLGCSNRPDRGAEVWTEPDVAIDDPRLRALASARLAPSSHNTQPWLVDLSVPNRIALLIDRSRCLPQADPLVRQTVISHGTFLELIDLALRSRGGHPTVTYAPDGMMDKAIAGERPLATVELTGGSSGPALRIDPQVVGLALAIPNRRTNKRLYDPGRAIAPSTLQGIGRVAGRPETELHWVVEPARIAKLAALCRDAMAVDVASGPRDQETAHWFRFSEEELWAKGDGFGLAQGGTTGWRRWATETFFLNRKDASRPGGTFTTKSVELCWQQAASATAFGVLTTKGNGRVQQLEAGRAYVRAQLATTIAGLQSHPFSQLLQEYPEMRKLHAKLRDLLGAPSDHTVQMLFRVGYAEPTPHAPRRPVQALVRG